MTRPAVRHGALRPPATLSLGWVLLWAALLGLVGGLLVRYIEVVGIAIAAVILLLGALAETIVSKA